MRASHSPDFGSRRQHEFENVQIREGSCSLWVIRVASLTLREGPSGAIFSLREKHRERWFFLAYQRTPDGLPDVLAFVWPTGPSRGLRVAFVWPSGDFVWPSCGLRFYFVFFSSRRQHEAPEGLPEGLTYSCDLRVYLVCSFDHQPEASRRHPKVNTMSA